MCKSTRHESPTSSKKLQPTSKKKEQLSSDILNRLSSLIFRPNRMFKSTPGNRKQLSVKWVRQTQWHTRGCLPWSDEQVGKAWMCTCSQGEMQESCHAPEHDLLGHQTIGTPGKATPGKQTAVVIVEPHQKLIKVLITNVLCCPLLLIAT